MTDDKNTSHTEHHTAPDGSEVTEHTEHHESSNIIETSLEVKSDSTDSKD